MGIFLTIIAVIIIFSVLVLIHELGHFVMARRAGIKVLEFGFGFPPRLFSIKRGETVYSFNAVPIGGFVKLYGEDAADPAVLRSRRSFASKTPWQRTVVIASGVLMNFLLAYVLLTIGFTFGIQPLLVTEEDLFTSINQGIVRTAPGVYVDTVLQESSAAAAGVQAGDQLLKVNDRHVADENYITFIHEAVTRDIDLLLRRDGKDIQVHLVAPGAGEDFGLQFKPHTLFPRPVIQRVANGSPMALSGLRKGDTILRINGREVYSSEEVARALMQWSEVTVTVLRATRLIDIYVAYPQVNRVLITDIVPNGSATAAGFVQGDVLLKIDGQEVFWPQQVQQLIRESGHKEMVYTVSRGNTEVLLRAKTNEQNVLGVILSPLTSIRGSEMMLYPGSIITSLIEIQDVKLPFLQAAKQAYFETKRLTVLTVGAFMNMIQRLASRFEIPEDIGGPVQIAVYTHAFVQEGIFALIRFAAILSLSLAVINILPIPALDGGRLLFVIIEVLRGGKRINARLEARIHGIGFALLILLIILVTYSDVLKIL